MNDDLRDEVAVPHFEDGLWDTLIAVHGEQRHGVSAPPPLDMTGHRRGRQRLLLVGIGSIAAAAAVVAAVVVTGSPDDKTVIESATTEPTPDLVERIAAATDEVGENAIVHTVQTAAKNGGGEGWSDEPTGYGRSVFRQFDGDVALDVGPATVPSPDDIGPDRSEYIPPGVGGNPNWPKYVERMVDYCWTEYTERETDRLPRGSWVQLVDERLANGELVEDGTEVVDGRELIRLVEIQPSEEQIQKEIEGKIGDAEAEAWQVGTTTTVPSTQAPGPTTTLPVTTPTTETTVPATTTTVPAIQPLQATTTESTVPVTQPSPTSTVPVTWPSETTTTGVPGTTTTAVDSDGGIDYDDISAVYYIDPETYLPVRIETWPGSDSWLTQVIDYLPRTAENLALLVPPVPEGFTLTTDSHGDGETFDRCGM